MGLTLLATVLLGAILTTAPAAVFWPAAAHYFQSNLMIFLSIPGLPGVFETNPNGPAANISLCTLDHEVACYLWVAICGGLGVIGRPDLMVAASVVMLITYAAEIGAKVDLPVFRYAFAFFVGQLFWMLRSRIILSPVFAVGLGVAAVALYQTALFLPVFTLAIAYATFCIGFARLPLSARVFQRADYS